MTHVFRIESVVAQFVIDDFIRREIIRPAVLEDILYSKEKGGLAYLVAVCTVFEMSDRTDCEYEFFRLHSRYGKSGNPPQCFGNFLHAHSFASEFRSRMLQAVGYYEVF